MNDKIEALRFAANEMLKHQLSGSKEGMNALQQLGDAADAVIAAATALQQEASGPARRLTEAEIEDCIDRASRKFSSRPRGPSGQQLTSYDAWQHWLAREVEDAIRAATTAPAGEVVVTKNSTGQIVAVTRQDEEGRVLKVIAQSEVATAPAGGVKNLQTAVRKVLVHHNLLNGRPGDGVIEADLIAALTTAARAAEPEPWVPYLLDRADGVHGHYCIARMTDKGIRETWSPKKESWGAFSDTVFVLGKTPPTGPSQGKNTS